MNQPVAVITTGIGQDAAAMCVYEVLLRCGAAATMRDATYSGTSGWSPQLGGVLNNGSCEAGRANDNGRITRVGDVCVSPFAVNWSCRQASWSMTAEGYPNQCTFPKQLFSAQSDFLFGQCEFTGSTARAALPFADEVIAAARKGLGVTPPLVQRPEKLQKDESQLWSDMAQGTKVCRIIVVY